MNNQSPLVVSATPQANGLMRALLMLAGWLCLLLGLIGVLLPLLPTAPFLLLAVAAFTRSSPAMAEWIYRLPLAGRYLRDWQEGGISPRMKWLALFVVWLTAVWTLAVIAKTALLKTVVVLLAVLTSLHLLFMPEKNAQRSERETR